TGTSFAKKKNGYPAKGGRFVRTAAGKGWGERWVATPASRTRPRGGRAAPADAPARTRRCRLRVGRPSASNARPAFDLEARRVPDQRGQRRSGRSPHVEVVLGVLADRRAGAV